MNIQPGDIYEKCAHTKTAVNAPKIRIVLATDKSVSAVPVNFIGQYGFTGKQPRTMSAKTLLASWRKV